jgi:hypothetical protein
MLWLVTLCVCSALLATTAAASPPVHAGASPGRWCGGVRWRLMTLSDPDRLRVHLDRIPTTIANLSAQTAPKVIGVRRTTGFQLVSWRMQVVIDRYRIASNGEIILVLYDIPSGMYMNAYLPNPHCLGPKARDRSGMIAARTAFTSHCPPPSTQWQLLGASVDISGVGFWNPTTTTRGALANGAELRPLTNLTIVSGCGVGTS